MDNKQLKLIRKTFVRQHDQQDCGIACMLSVIRFYQGNSTFERLRELSGTSTQGASMLGLVQAAPQIGLKAKGLQGTIEAIKELKSPVILHVILDKRLQHFVVYYGYNPKDHTFLIGDPGKGIIKMTSQELKEIWQSKALITLEPDKNFILQKTQQKQKINYFLQILKEDYTLLLIAAILGIGIAGLGLAMAIFSQKLIDEILPEKNTKKLILGIVLLAFLLFMKAFLGYLRGFFLNRQSQVFNNRLIESFLSKLFYLPQGFFNNRKTGDLIARLDDTRRIQQNISFLIGSVVIDILVIIISTIFLFQYHWIVGLLSVIGIPLYTGLTLIFNRKILQSQRAVMEAYAKNESNYINIIQGINTIKSYQKEPLFLKATQTIYNFFQKTIYQLGLIGVRFNFLAELIGIILIILAVSFSCYLVLTDQIKTGELIAVLGIVGGIIPSISRLAVSNIPIQEAKIAFDRMYEFTSLTTEKVVITNSLPEKILTLEVKNLAFRFPGRKALFQNFSLLAQRGEILNIIGENGSGKSTLFQILQGFYTIEQGEILINGTSYQELGKDYLREQIAIVPQEIKVFNGTLLENICLDNPQEHLEKVLLFCKEMGFEKYFMDLPQNYFTIIGEQGVHLSGGQKQMMSLARALYKKPQILLLDEFSSAMDSQAGAFVANLLENLKNEMIILSVSHVKVPQLSIDKEIYFGTKTTIAYS